MTVHKRMSTENDIEAEELLLSLLGEDDAQCAPAPTQSTGGTPSKPTAPAARVDSGMTGGRTSLSSISHPSVPTAAAASPSQCFQAFQGEAVRALQESDATRRLAKEKEVVTESRTKIRISRPTAFVEQLPVLFAQYEYVPMAAAGASAMLSASASSSASFTNPTATIGAIVFKSDVKSNAAGSRTFGIVKLWSLRGASNSGPEVVSAMLCDSAFQAHFNKLYVGCVVFVCKLTALPPQADKKEPTCMLKVSELEQLRVLGHAMDLKPCKAVSKSSSEQCKQLVNAEVMPYCSYHLSEHTKDVGLLLRAKRMAPAAAPLPSAMKSSPPLSAPKTFFTPSAGPLTVPSSLSRPLLTVPSRAIPKQTESFIAVRGGNVVPSSGAKQVAPADAGGVYAGVRREALTITGPNREAVAKAPPPKVIASPSVLGVTARGRQVLAQAIQSTDERTKEDTIRKAMTMKLTTAVEEIAARETRTTKDDAGTLLSSRKRSRCDDAVTFVSTPAPVTSGLAPLASHCYNNQVIVRHVDPKSAIIGTSRAGGDRLVAAMAQALLPSGSRSIASASSTTTAHTLAGRVADTVQSSNNDLREVAERERIDANFNRVIAIEKAMATLDDIKEQPVKAILCKTCNRFSYTRSRDCVAAGHNLVTAETVRRFLKCSNCEHRVTLLGTTNPSLLLPTCPRCKSRCTWEQSSAAPQSYISKAVKSVSDEDWRKHGDDE